MAKDIILSEPFKNGDWNVAHSDQQHIEHLCLSAPGHFKIAPLAGINLLSWLNAPFSPKNVAELERNIRLQLESDGAKNITIEIDVESKTINTNGTYPEN